MQEYTKEELLDMLGKTRLCLTCGKTRDAEISRETPGCEETPEYGHICLFDATPQEAIEHFKELAEKNRRNAERYRWLRDVGDATWAPMSKRGVTSSEIDEAIDRAILEKVLEKTVEAIPRRDWCTDPDNCSRCKAPIWDQNKHHHAGIPLSRGEKNE